jgi:hypothetical protein
LIEATDVMKEVLRSLKEEPGHLLALICREYEKTGQPVPDHRLHCVGYMGEAALRALVSAGMIHRHAGGGLALYTYEPTVEGKSRCDGLEKERRT